MTLSQRTWQLMLKLCRQPSISATAGEKEIARFIHNTLAAHPWFTANPDLLGLEPEQSPVVWGLVRGKSGNTVVLLNHHDVVDIDDYGRYRKLAFDPEALTRTLAPEHLPAAARKDLLSGKWLFGRGTNDMKYGLALQLALTEQLAHYNAELPGSVLFLSVPDEENMSGGMRQAVPILTRLQDTYNLNYIAAVNSEPHHGQSGNHVIQTGSDGKLLALLYCVGRETHAGAVLEGLNPHLLLAETIRALELNTDFCEKVGEEATLPPTVLAAGDSKQGYNISTPAAAWALLNIFTLDASPADILAKLERGCARAMEQALQRFNQALENTPGKHADPNWQARVIRWSQLEKLAALRYGPDLKEEIEDYVRDHATVPPNFHQLTLGVVHHVHQLCSDHTPKIVIAFAPPVYPPVRNTGTTAKEKNALTAVAALQRFARDELDISLSRGEFHRGISDLSYCTLQQAKAYAAGLAANFPLWGVSYHLPLEDMARLDMPVLNLGPLGRDFHKFTERLHIPTAREVTPRLLEQLVRVLWAHK